jgi:hypothetical protein
MRMSVLARSGPSDRSAVPEGNSPAAQLLRAAMEGVVLALVCLSPWAFGAVEPVHELWLYAGLTLLLALAGLRGLLAGEFTWRKCPVALCLAGLFLLAVVQTLSLPARVLATLSPAAAETYARLLPAQPEELPDGEDWQAGFPRAGSTLSLYPGATRQALVRLLAVLVLFTVVRNHMASSAALWRLSVAALLNGALLALFAVVQSLTSPDHVLYWTYPVPTNGFGPFVCRNHFPFYVNLCLGLGLGVLLALLQSSRAEQRGAGARSSAWIGPLENLLARPPAVWTAAGLSLLLIATFFSLSRGGLLAAAGAAVVCLGLRLVVSLRPGAFAAQLTITALLAGLTLAPMAWLGFGFDPMVRRLASLQEDTTFRQSRGDLWARALPLAAEYPIWGTGYGTFGYIEPLRRHHGEDANILYEHAHNDYLEALIEGGLVRSVLSLLAIGLVCRYALRALRRYDGTPVGGLAWGATFALATVLIHSFGDFGLHVPAIAVLVTVLCAQLCALGDEADAIVRLRGPAPWLAAAIAVALGLALCGAGREVQICHDLRLAAGRLHEVDAAGSRERRLHYLHEAARRSPESVFALIELGQVYTECHDEDVARRQENDRSHAAAQLVLDSAVAPGLSAAVAWAATAALRAPLQQADAAERAGRYLLPALRAYLQARGVCPLLPEPYAALATHGQLLRQAEPRSAYLARVKYLAPGDPQVWYMCGVQELLDDPSQAFASWRRCLELSDRYLPDVLARLGKDAPPELLEQVLPDRPALLLKAAGQLYPDPDGAAQRRPLLARGVRLLAAGPQPLKAADSYLQAQLLTGLERKEEAVTAYRHALALEPAQISWRLELAQLLLACGQAREAGRELSVVLAQRPGDATAQALLEAVRRYLAEKG